MQIPKYTAFNGYEMPQVGFGTYKLKGYDGVAAIKSAIENGYRYLDTAYNYENEATVGEAIRQSEINRAELQIASKLPGRYHDYYNALITIEESLLRADLDYYDLYLIHWPNPKEGKYVEAWQALIEAKKRGYVKQIGVSNFMPEQIDGLIAETGECPVVNQVELHPYFIQEEQRQYDDKKGIITQSWSPLTRGTEKIATPVIVLPIVEELAQKYGKTPTQIVLRWHIQLGAMPICKAGSTTHQKENIAIFDFELTPEDVEKISASHQADGRINGQDPREYQEF